MGRITHNTFHAWTLGRVTPRGDYGDDLHAIAIEALLSLFLPLPKTLSASSWDLAFLPMVDFMHAHSFPDTF